MYNNKHNQQFLLKNNATTAASFRFLPPFSLSLVIPFFLPPFFVVFLLLPIVNNAFNNNNNNNNEHNNLLVDSGEFAADIVSQAFVQTGSELHYFRDISHHHHHHQQQQQDGGVAAGVAANGNKINEGSQAEDASAEALKLFETDTTDFGQSSFGVPVQRRVFLANPTDATIIISAITSSSISFHCSFVEQQSLASRQRTSLRVYFLPVVDLFGQQREVLKVHTSVGTFVHRVLGETVGNPYRIRSFLGVRLPLNATFSTPFSVYNPHTKPMVMSELFVSDCNVRLELNDGTMVQMKRQRSRSSNSAGEEGTEASLPEADSGHNDGGDNDEALSMTNWRFRPFETREIGRAVVLGNAERNSTAFIVAKMRTTTSSGNNNNNAAGGVNRRHQQQRQQQQTSSRRRTIFNNDDDAVGSTEDEQSNNNNRNAKAAPETAQHETDQQLLIVAISVQVTRRRGLFPTVDLLDFGYVRAGDTVSPRTFSVYSSLERGVEIESIYVERRHSRGVYLQFESRPPISIKSGARGQPGLPVTVASVNIDTNTLLLPQNQATNRAEFSEEFEYDEEDTAAKGGGAASAEAELERQQQQAWPGSANGSDGSSTMVRHGMVVAETRGGNYKVSIPFRAVIYKGELEHDKEATAFHHALEPAVWREVTVTNSLPFGLAVWGVEVAANASDSFQASIVSHPAVTLAPGQSLPVLLLTYVQKQPVDFTSHLTLHTNVTTFTLPIIVFGGDLRVRLYAHKQTEFDFGSVGWDERRTILFSLSNPNPVTLRLSRLHAPFPDLISLSFMGVVHHNHDNRTTESVGQMVERFSSSLTAGNAVNGGGGWSEGLDFALPAHSLALFNMTLTAHSHRRNTVPSSGVRMFRIQTQFAAAYEFPVQFDLVDAHLESVPSQIVFHDSFIGTVQTHPIKFFNTFSHALHIHRLSIADDDPRFLLFHHQTKNTNNNNHSSTAAAASDAVKQLTIPPSSLVTVANVAFVPGSKCPAESCYLGIQLDTSDGQWFAYGMKLPQNLAEIDHYLYTRLRQKWLAIGNQKVVKTQLRMDTDRVKNLEVPIEGHLVWPRLLSHSVVHFPLTAVGNFTIVNLTLSNPTTNAVIVQLLPLVIYPDAEFLLDLFRAELPVPLADPVEMNETLMFSLRDTELFTLRPGSPVPQLREEVETILGAPVPRFTQTLLLRPGMSTRIRIGFLPNDYALHSSLLLIRNNLTALEPVVLYGRGAKMHMDIDNKTARSLPLLFEILPQHLADCANPRRQLHKLPTTLTVRRSFVVRNSGEVGFSVFNISISNTACENRGFRVLNCDRFRLAPNETTLLDIAYTPDFLLTTNEATLQLYMHMNGTPWSYDLVATIPPHLISVCHAALPRPPFESMMYYTCVFALTFCFICVVSCAYLEGDRVISCAYRQQFAVVSQSHDEKLVPSIDLDAVAASVPDEPCVGLVGGSGSRRGNVSLSSSSSTAAVDDEQLMPSRKTQFLHAAQDAGPLNKLFWRTLNFILWIFSYVWPLVRGGNNKQSPIVGRRKQRKGEAAARKAAASQQQTPAVVPMTATTTTTMMVDEHGNNGRRAADEAEEVEEIIMVPKCDDDDNDQNDSAAEAMDTNGLMDDHDDDDDAEEDEHGEGRVADDTVLQHPKDPEQHLSHLSTTATTANSSNNTANGVLMKDNKNDDADNHDDEVVAVATVDDVLDFSDPYLYMKFRSFLNAEKQQLSLERQQQQQQNSASAAASSSSTATKSTATSEKQQQQQPLAATINGTTINNNSSRVSRKKQRIEKKRSGNKPMEVMSVEHLPTTNSSIGSNKKCSPPTVTTTTTTGTDSVGKQQQQRRRQEHHRRPVTPVALMEKEISSTTGSDDGDNLMLAADDADCCAASITKGAVRCVPPSSSSSSSISWMKQGEDVKEAIVTGKRPEWFDRMFTKGGCAGTTLPTPVAMNTTNDAHDRKQQHNRQQRQQRQHAAATTYREEEIGTAFVWQQLYPTKFHFEEQQREEAVHEEDNDHVDAAAAAHLLEADNVAAGGISGSGGRLNDNGRPLTPAEDEQQSDDDADNSSETSAPPEWADQGIDEFKTDGLDADFFALADQSAEFFEQISNGDCSSTSLQSTKDVLVLSEEEDSFKSTNRTLDQMGGSKKDVVTRKNKTQEAEDARIQHIIDTLTQEYREKLTKVLNSARNPMLDIHQLLDDLNLSPATFDIDMAPLPSSANSPTAEIELTKATSFAAGNNDNRPKGGRSASARIGGHNSVQQSQKCKSPGREFSARLRVGGSDEAGQKLVNRATTSISPSAMPKSNITLFNIEDPIWKPIGALDERHGWPAQFMKRGVSSSSSEATNNKSTKATESE